MTCRKTRSSPKPVFLNTTLSRERPQTLATRPARQRMPLPVPKVHVRASYLSPSFPIYKVHEPGHRALFSPKSWGRHEPRPADKVLFKQRIAPRLRACASDGHVGAFRARSRGSSREHEARPKSTKPASCQPPLWRCRSRGRCDCRRRGRLPSDQATTGDPSSRRPTAEEGP